MAIGDGFGVLFAMGSDAPTNSASTLDFDGCGLVFRLMAAGAHAAGQALSSHDLIAIANATLDGCAPTGEHGNEPAPRFFLVHAPNVPDVGALDARVGFDAVLPSYLPEGVTASAIHGYPLLPGRNASLTAAR